MTDTDIVDVLRRIARGVARSGDYGRCDVAADEIERLRAENHNLHGHIYASDRCTSDECKRLQAENERLREVVRQRTKLLDDQFGTPCEEIRHAQEIERLRVAIKKYLSHQLSHSESYVVLRAALDGKEPEE
jgi:hypothetical protein